MHYREGEKKIMKNIRIAMFCVLSLFLLSLAGSATAYNAAYTHIEYSTANAPTINGQYAQGDEWIASKPENFGTNGVWRDEWMFGASIYAYILVETADATDDAGDYFELCFDGNADGGATPQADDYRVVITGHGATATIQWYKGNGATWVTTTVSSVTWAQSLSASPKISTPHYILEMAVDKWSTDLPLSERWAFRVAYNDAHASGYGLQQWPPAPAARDVPAGWGYIDYASSANPVPDVPEGIGFGAMAIVSSIALVAGTYYIRKRNKT